MRDLWFLFTYRFRKLEDVLGHIVLTLGEHFTYQDDRLTITRTRSPSVFVQLTNGEIVFESFFYTGSMMFDHWDRHALRRGRWLRYVRSLCLYADEVSRQRARVRRARDRDNARETIALAQRARAESFSPIDDREIFGND
jgi:hypothetical protein